MREFNTRLILGLLFLIAGLAIGFNLKAQLVFADSHAPGPAYYVDAVSGDDSGDGSNEQPFKTIQKARDRVRGDAAKGISGATVYLRGGIYYLGETLLFDSNDSGVVNEPNIWRNYPGEKPILRFSKDLDNGKFRPVSGAPLLQTNLVLQQGLPPNTTVSQLFIDGILQTPARQPNYIEPDFTQEDPWDAFNSFFFVDRPSEKDAGFNTFYYKDDDFNPSWSNITDIQVVIWPRRGVQNDIANIKSADTANQKITLNRNLIQEIWPNNRYYFQHVFEALDAPKEWYYNKNGKMLYLYDSFAGSLVDHRVSVPINQDAGILIDGGEYLVFNGLTIEEFNGCGILLNDAKHTSITNCQIHNGSDKGISVEGLSDNLTIKNNHLYELGHSSIFIAEISPGQDTYRKNLTPRNIEISYNLIHDIAKLYHRPGAIYAKRVVGVNIAHNEIYNTHGVGIFFCGNNSTIEYNAIYDVNRSVKDTGGIYTNASIRYSWLYRGNNIRYNYIRNPGGYGQEEGPAEIIYKYPYGNWGIYLDDFTSGVTVEGNIVEDTYYGGFQNHSGRDNVIENNIFIEGKKRQVYFQGIDRSNKAYPRMWDELYALLYKEPYDPQSSPYDRDIYKRQYGEELSKIESPDAMEAKPQEYMDYDSFQRNIIYYPDSRRAGAGIYYFALVNDTDLTNSVIDNNMQINNNIFWDRKPPAVPAWPQRDANSIEADPLFINPEDPHQRDYVLQPNSAAFGLGFKSIDFGSIGRHCAIAYPKNGSFVNTEAVTLRGRAYGIDVMQFSKYFLTYIDPQGNEYILPEQDGQVSYGDLLPSIPVQEGCYTALLHVIDNEGNEFVSAPVKWTVDLTPAVITINNPAAGVVLSRVIALKAKAGDIGAVQSGIKKVQFFFKQTGMDNSTYEELRDVEYINNTYRRYFDTATVNNGSYDIKASVTDKAGNKSEQRITVIINNLSDEPVYIPLPATGSYGYITNSADRRGDYQESLSKATFTFTCLEVQPYLLYYDSYDIDISDEVGIYLNGKFIGYAQGNSSGWQKKRALLLPYNKLLTGDNKIIFKNLLWIKEHRPCLWGVSNISAAMIRFEPGRGGLGVYVKDKNNNPAVGTWIVIYDSAWQKVADGVTDEKGYYLFDNLPAGTVNYELYHPKEPADKTCFWASGELQVTEGAVTERRVNQKNPYIQEVAIKNSQGVETGIFAPGETVTVTVTIKNDEYVTRNTYPILYMDPDKAFPYEFNRSNINEAIELAPGETTSFTFNWTIPGHVTGGTIYYLYGQVDSKYSSEYSRTDISDWVLQFRIAIPAQIENFTATANQTQASIHLQWKKPQSKDYAGVLIRKKVNSAPASITDGDFVAESNASSYVDNNLKEYTHYYYSAFSYDDAGNYSLPVTADAVTGEFSLPFIEDFRPQDKSVQVPCDANITFHINDAASGVDKDSIVLEVNGEQIILYDPDNEVIIPDIGHHYGFIKGTPQDYIISYDPIDDFDYEQTVNMTIRACDLYSAVNQINQQYSFVTQTIDIGYNVMVNSPNTGNLDLTQESDVSIAIDPSNSKHIYVVWEAQNRTKGDWDIYFAKSIDSGRIFTESKNIFPDPDGFNQRRPQIVFDSNEIFITCQGQDTEGKEDIYLLNSTDGSQTFSPPKKINIGTAIAEYPSIARSYDNHLHLIWLETDETDQQGIYRTELEDFSDTDYSINRVDDGSFDRFIGKPLIKCSREGAIYIVFCAIKKNESASHIYLSKISNEAIMLPKRIDDGITAAYLPIFDISSDGADVYIAWVYDGAGGKRYITFAKSEDSGENFTINEFITDDSLNSSRTSPSLCVDKNEGKLYIAWSDARNDRGDIYLAQSLDKGVSFGTNILINDDAGMAGQSNPVLITDFSAQNIYLAWPDTRNNAVDIYFAKNSKADIYARDTIDGQGGPVMVTAVNSAINGAAVIVPQGGLEIDTTISIGQVDNHPEFSTLDSADSVGRAIRFSPGGTVFGIPATIRIPYSQEELDAAGISVSSLAAYLYNSLTTLWEKQPVSAIYPGYVEITTQHFSLFMLGGNGSGSGSARSILGGGNCFIATAAYGTPLADQVRILCRFRDEYLMKTALGRKAVEFYYKVSPPIARAVSKSWVLRRIIRLLLRPVVEMVKLAVG